MDFIAAMFCIFLLILIWLLLLYLIRIPYIDNIHNKYVLITGCDTGFGRVAASQIDKLGCHVIASCLTETGSKSLQNELSSRSFVILMDVTKTDSISAAFNTVKEWLPESQGLWGLINNAGIAASFGLCDWLNKENYKQSYQVNVFGMQEVVKTFLPLIKRTEGRIVNTASCLGVFAPVFASVYSSSKFAVIGITDCLRRELIHFGVSVHTIEPGGHKTNLTEEQRVTACTMQSWNNLSEKHKEEYGAGYPETLLWTLHNVFGVFNSADIGRVVNAYEHAVFAKYPKTRYKIGFDSYMFTFLRLLPDWISDALFAIVMPRPKRRPGFPTVGDLIYKYQVKPNKTSKGMNITD